MASQHSLFFANARLDVEEIHRKQERLAKAVGTSSDAWDVPGVEWMSASLDHRHWIGSGIGGPVAAIRLLR